MRDLVTGATGFIGSHLVRALLAEGRPVRALVREGNCAYSLGKMGAEIVEGDITIPSSLPRVLDGIDRVFHCAAMVSDWGAWDDFRLANVQGVDNMLAASRVAGVRHFIHLSTTDVYGFPRRPGDEEEPFQYRGWPYGDTKIDGEKKVWKYHEKYGLPVTVIRPANVYGAGSRSFVLEIARMLKNRDMVHLGNGGQSAGLCHVNNLVTCILLAGRNGNSVGQSYNVTDGTDLSWREFVELLAEKSGMPGPRITLPRRLAYLTGWLMERFGNPARENDRPLLTRMAVEIFTADQAFSIGKARRELGYRPTETVEGAMDGMVAWLVGEGC